MCGEVADFSRWSDAYYCGDRVPTLCREGLLFQRAFTGLCARRARLATFRMFTSQLAVNGHVTQAQISRTFGVPLVTGKRYVRLYRRGGVRVFFAPPKRRGGHRLTAEVCQRAQILLDKGLQVPEVGRRVGILANTLHKAIRAGRLARNI